MKVVYCHVSEKRFCLFDDSNLLCWHLYALYCSHKNLCMEVLNNLFATQFIKIATKPFYFKEAVFVLIHEDKFNKRDNRDWRLRRCWHTYAFRGVPSLLIYYNGSKIREGDVGAGQRMSRGARGGESMVTAWLIVTGVPDNHNSPAVLTWYIG